MDHAQLTAPCQLSVVAHDHTEPLTTPVPFDDSLPTSLQHNQEANLAWGKVCRVVLQH
jgi:hypothetical protein